MARTRSKHRPAPGAKKAPAAGARADRPADAGPSPGAVLGQNSYGKSRVRLVKVSRAGAPGNRHTVRELSIDIALEGAFDAVHTRGDNAACLPTDTMKNTVYALGKDAPLASIEEFALRLGAHFVAGDALVSLAEVSITAVPWDRVTVGGREHPHCFTKGTEERATCEVVTKRTGAAVVSGIAGLTILKSTDSAFSGFRRDAYTTLAETRDRIMATSVTADWQYSQGPPVDYEACRAAIRRALVETFATHKSESVQQTLFAMGRAALAACGAIERIRLSLPNKHCLLVNLAPFGLSNENEVFVPTDEPHGLIEATVERATTQSARVEPQRPNTRPRSAP